MVTAEDLEDEEPKEESEEVESEEDVEEVYEIVAASSPPTSRVLMKAGTSIVEVESTEALSVIVETATTLFKQVFPIEEKRRLTAGFGSFESELSPNE